MIDEEQYLKSLDLVQDLISADRADTALCVLMMSMLSELRTIREVVNHTDDVNSRTRAAVEQLVVQFDQVSSGGNVIQTVQS